MACDMEGRTALSCSFVGGLLPRLALCIFVLLPSRVFLVEVQWFRTNIYSFISLDYLLFLRLQTWFIHSFIFIYSYLPTPPLGQDMTQGQFLAEFNRFEFRVFLLLDLLPHQGWRTQSVLLFTHSWMENNWIHTFPKGISAMWNAISLVQNLNSCRRVHFLRR